MISSVCRLVDDGLISHIDWRVALTSYHGATTLSQPPLLHKGAGNRDARKLSLLQTLAAHRRALP